MNPKLGKISVEYEKNRVKISELQGRQRELDRQRREIENNEILELVQSFKLDAEGLAALLNSMNNNPAPSTSAMGAPAKRSFVGERGSDEYEVRDDEKEDFENETEND